MSESAIRLICCLALLAASAIARNKDKKVPEKDSFDVVGHIALDRAAITQLVATRHFGSNYVYAENSAAHTVSIIDVTDARHPRVLSVTDRGGSLVAAAGDAALVSSEPPEYQNVLVNAPVRTISIVDFSDKANPRVTREFPGVTSIGSDDQRGLVFLTNSEGLWILHRNQALDPEIQERYAHDVVYNH